MLCAGELLQRVLKTSDRPVVAVNMMSLTARSLECSTSLNSSTIFDNQVCLKLLNAKIIGQLRGVSAVITQVLIHLSIEYFKKCEEETLISSSMPDKRIYIYMWFHESELWFVALSK